MSATAAPSAARSGLTHREALEIVARLCARARVPCQDARLVQPPVTNAVVLLPQAGLVARIADAAHMVRMRRELEVCAWLGGRGIPVGSPATAALPCPQLSVAGGRGAKQGHAESNRTEGRKEVSNPRCFIKRIADTSTAPRDDAAGAWPGPPARAPDVRRQSVLVSYRAGLILTRRRIGRRYTGASLV